MTKRAFSAITQASAARLLRGFKVAKESGYETVRLQGAWKRRRFVIDSASVTKDPLACESAADPLALTLDLPSDIDVDGFVRESRTFGAVVERLWRDSVKGQFDYAASADDGQRHCVHRYHHVAVCGHKAGRWLSDVEAQSITKVDSCARCMVASVSKPPHHTRWHPLSV